MSVFDTFTGQSKPEYQEYTVRQYSATENASVDDIIDHFKHQKQDSSLHYMSQWKKTEFSSEETSFKEQVLDTICSSIINVHNEVQQMCRIEIEKLMHGDVEEILKVNGFKAFEAIYSSWWPLNALRLKGYEDSQNNAYSNGRISDFEFFLQSYFRQKVMIRELPIEEARTNYMRDITIYRGAYFESTSKGVPGNNFFLQVDLLPNIIDFNSEEHISIQAREDAIQNVDGKVNTYLLKTLQSTFNKELDIHAVDVKRKLYEATTKLQKMILQEAKLAEEDTQNRFEHIFNLYFHHFTQTRMMYMSLTQNKQEADFDFPNSKEYPLSKHFEHIDNSFDIATKETLVKRVEECISHYKETDSDDCFKTTESQIRSYYQEQLSRLFEKIDIWDEDVKAKIETEELSYLEEYKQKIAEFRNLCMQNSQHKFTNHAPLLNVFSDYSFSIHPLFHGLDKGQIYELAVVSGYKEDLSLHNLERIRLKTSEFININCIEGDKAGHLEQEGNHDVNVVMEKYAMIEQRLLIFCATLSGIYIQTLRHNYNGDEDAFVSFETRAEDLMQLPLATYFDNKFEISGAQKQAKIDKENYSSPELTPYYTKMRNATQQKIYDAIEVYGPEIERIKGEYIKNGDRVSLNTVFQRFRIEIDRLVDEHSKLENYYTKEFDNKAVVSKEQFELSEYYDFQKKQKKQKKGSK